MTSKNSLKRLLLRLIIVLLALIANLAAYIYFRPLEFSEIMTEISFFRSGVQNIESNGLKGYYRDFCQGNQDCACVALVHGLGDYAMTWYKVLNSPAEKFTTPMKLYAFHLPGTYGSQTPSDLTGYKVRTMANTVADAMKPFCKKWTVVGNSLGGLVTLWLVADHPDMINNMALENAAGMSHPIEDERVSRMLTQPTLESLKEFRKLAYANPQSLPDYAWRGAVRWQKKSPAYVMMKAQTIEGYPNDQVLASIQVPVHLVWGIADQVMPVSRAYEFKTKLKNTVLKEIPNCGHLPHKECLDDFLAALNVTVQMK